jgi:hypothetical protein
MDLYVWAIVANQFAQSALKGEDAPIILACSTNKSSCYQYHGKTKLGYLQNRWLLDIEVDATYLPANNKGGLEQNYKKQNDKGLFSKIENDEYLQKAKSVYLDKAKQYFKSSFLDICTATEKFRNEIKEIKKELKDASLLWGEYINAEEIFKNIYAGKKLYPHELLDKNVLQGYIKKLNLLEDKIISYFKTEPFANKLFCFLKNKTALENRFRKIDIILRDSLLQVKILIYN